MKTSVQHSYIPGRAVKPLQLQGKTQAETEANIEDALRGLTKLGIGLDEKAVATIARGMDALTPTVTTGAIPTLVQFLQNWLPGYVYVLTAARKIDEIIGIQTIGSWEDEEIVQGIMELTGTAVPYGDTTNVPLSSWNTNYEKRTVVRFEEGMRVGILEEARSSRIRVDSASAKRQSATLALEINRNQVGFYGYANGDNNTWGYLNDPGLLSYVVFPDGAASSPSWTDKTFYEITADIRGMVSDLRSQAQDQIDPRSTPMTLTLPTNRIDYLSVTAQDGGAGYPVWQWLKDSYPTIRVVSAPELEDAHSNENVAYLQADKVDDMSSDGGLVWLQVVPSKFQLLGVQKLAKGYEEDYSNATAGAMCKRPYAVVRRYGL